jgi:hypothetical protein
VTRRDLHAARIDLDVALRAARRGDWQDVLPGAWLRSAGTVTRAHRQQAALALLGPDAVLSGADACFEYGLRDVPDDGRLCVLVPHRMRRDLGPQVRLVRTATAAASYRMRGRRWVDPARAVFDAAAEHRLQAVRGLVTAAAADSWVEPEQLRGLLAQGPRRGSAVLRRAVGDVEAGARSAPEAEAADLLAVAVRRRRLPPFLLNPDVYLHGEFLLTSDLWLVGTGVGGELDSRRHHGSQVSLDATLARHAVADRRGIALVHRSPQCLRRTPEDFLRELRDRVADTPEPPGLVVVPRGPLLPLPPRGRADR